MLHFSIVVGNNLILVLNILALTLHNFQMLLASCATLLLSVVVGNNLILDLR